MKINAEKERAVRVISHYEDFTPYDKARKSEEWKIAFYEMWRLQMTWGYAYEIEARDSHKNGAYIDILTKECYVDNVKSTMEDFGFGKITTHEEGIMLVDGFDLDDETYEVFVAW